MLIQDCEVDVKFHTWGVQKSMEIEALASVGNEGSRQIFLYSSNFEGNFDDDLTWLDVGLLIIVLNLAGMNVVLTIRKYWDRFTHTELPILTKVGTFSTFFITSTFDIFLLLFYYQQMVGSNEVIWNLIF